MSFKYSEEHLAFLRQEFKKMRVPALTEAFNQAFGLDKTSGQITACLKNHKITCGRPAGLLKGERRAITHEQEAFLREAYPRMSVKLLTDAFNKEYGTSLTVEQMKTRVTNYGIQSGRTGCFEKGHKPWNNGTQGQGLCKPNSGSFKKGQKPVGTKEVGAERTTKDGYIEVKVAQPNVWKQKHRWIWEVANGPIPPGMIIRFKDFDKANCVLDNLEMISMAENAVMNKMGGASLPEEVRPSAQLLARVHNQKKTLERSESADDMKRSAVFSPCRAYRYQLWRVWNESLPVLVVIGLNPSTADESVDDPTIRRCIGFAREWGFGRLCMVNLFAFRSTDPKEMLVQPDPLGTENNQYIRQAVDVAGLVLAAWGVHGAHGERGCEVIRMIEKKQQLYCLGKTQCGQPRHPLYVKGDVKPVTVREGGV